MLRHKLKLIVLLTSLLVALSGCASSPKPGRVVVAPEVEEPPIPALVKETPARPTGYYQKLILDALQEP